MLRGWGSVSASLWRAGAYAIAVALLAAVTGCGSGMKSQPNQGDNGGSNNPPSALLSRISTDTYTNSDSQHATEVEPELVASGSTLVAVFQMGRYIRGGASNIGYATSSDGGVSWTNGTLPGTTTFAGGIYNAISDPAVAYDRAHASWLVTSLAISSTDTVVVSHSPDGVSWSAPVVISTTPDSDKNWIACDNTASSPYYGHCYVEWDDPSDSGHFWMSTSTDGGQTWSAPAAPADNAKGLGGVPVVQANGTVIVPASDDAGTHMIAFTSTDGGSSWTASTIISTISDHTVAGDLRSDALPTSAIDAGGLVYVAWQDCRFRSACASNDIVMSTSSDGARWSDPVRIPIDATTSTVDHFLATVAVDPSTSGSSAHLTLVYHYYPTAACSPSDCALDVAYVTSQDGGASWSSPTALAGPMTIAWLADTSQGRMVGDYVGVTYVAGRAFPAIAVARANNGTTFDEAIYTSTDPLIQARGVLSAKHEPPIPGARSDHAAREFYDEEGRYPRKPPISKRRMRRSK